LSPEAEQRQPRNHPTKKKALLRKKKLDGNVTSSHEHTTHTQNRTDDEYHADAREERTKRKGEEGSKMSASASASAAKSGSDVENPPPSNKGALDNVADLEKKKKEEKKATNLNKKMDRLAKKERKQSFWKLHKEELWSLVPYLWPKEQLWIRFMLLCAIFFLLASKLCNVTSPIALKIAVDRVSESRADIEWAIVAYGALRFGANFFGELKDNSFAYVSAHASRKISLRVFTHVMDLSLKFHITRKTGAVIRGCARGSESFALLLKYISFQIAPIFIEVAMVCCFLLVQYDWYFGIITFFVIFAYIGFTVPFTEWRNKFRREQTEADDRFNQKATDSLLNFETIKLFCAEPHIAHTYDEALKQTQKATLKTTQSLAGLNLGQALIITIGITASMGLAAEQVVDGNMTIGDFVLVNTFILQLYVPLNFLGTYYRMIKQCMVDVEAMFRLMGENQEVADADDAKDLVLTNPSQAKIEYENVFFSYDPKEDRKILKGVSFVVEPGQKLALVGESGAGKSTIAKLLYRLYDIQGGRILINGQDVAKCTQRSVRLNIGIVPQDCVLFNDTIEYNIGFGKLGQGEVATREEVQKASQAAQFEKFVNQTPSGYDTLVGERGLRLSGGEKQRVAIARALLKDPPIMVYDEATSSLDTHTENQIMDAIRVAAKGRTNLVIAHRLSTIMDSDRILVLSGGEVVESGNHQTLYADVNGKYRKMWDSQLQAAMKESPSTVELMEMGNK
jgi:ABC-type transport system involved in Fe-S cluster assembly fused permease/ATPase subunit